MTGPFFLFTRGVSTAGWRSREGQAPLTRKGLAEAFFFGTSGA